MLSFRRDPDVRVTFFAHDLSDPATARRVRMLKLGGASVNLLGFRRSAMPVRELEGTPAIDLGQTFNGRLASRCTQVLRHVLAAAKWRAMVTESDVLLARNLEMATLADAARAIHTFHWLTNALTFIALRCEIAFHRSFSAVGRSECCTGLRFSSSVLPAT